MNINPIVVDLSHYQNVTDWHAVYASGIRGVINKATEGAGMTDKTFAIRRGPAVAVGLLYGGYHFLRPGDPVAQAEHFLDVVKPYPGLLLALDHEDKTVPLDAAKRFMTVVKAATGRYPILYSGYLIKQQMPAGVDSMLAQTKLWLSHYSAVPKWPETWAKPWLWQYSDGAVGPLPHTINGVQGGMVDMNSFDGDAAALSASWAT